MTTFRTAPTMPRKAEGLGMPWEDQYGYAQAVQVGDTIYVSGQLSHDDEGNMVAPAPLDAEGRIVDHTHMEAQMRQTYANARKILARFGASLSDVVEEVIYVTDMDTAFDAAGPVRKEAYGSPKADGRKHHPRHAPTGAADPAHRDQVHCESVRLRASDPA